MREGQKDTAGRKINCEGKPRVAFICVHNSCRRKRRKMYTCVYMETGLTKIPLWKWRMLQKNVVSGSLPPSLLWQSTPSCRSMPQTDRMRLMRNNF